LELTSFENGNEFCLIRLSTAPARDILITYTKPSVDRVRVICIASGLFPEPIVEIYSSGSYQQRLVLLLLSTNLHVRYKMLALYHTFLWPAHS